MNMKRYNEQLNEYLLGDAIVRCVFWIGGAILLGVCLQRTLTHFMG